MSSPFPLTSTSFPPASVSKVLLVDDHAAIIEMMVQLVDSLPNFKVVGTALDAQSALAICNQQEVNVIVLDLVLPDISGLTLLAEINALKAPPKVLVFTGSLTPAAMRGALSGGVLGVVEKMASLEIFRAALQSVAAGQTYFGPLAGDMIKGLVSRNEAGQPGIPDLTKRERTVLTYVAQGLSSREIADKLGVSVHTVINHRSNLMKKTGLRRVAQLSLYAAQAGLIGETVSNVPANQPPGAA